MGEGFRERVNDAKGEMLKVDQRADSLLLKVVKSKWSWAIVAGVLLAVWLLG